MSGSLNISKVNDYTERFSAEVLNTAYATKAKLGGEDLLNLTPIRQINLGVLNQLFDIWKNTASAFRSPYFDFDHEDVKHALEMFMNKTSQFISISREDLSPLVKEAVKDSLVLLYTPENYFEEKLRSIPDAIFNTEQASKFVKYTHIHGDIAKLLQKELIESGSDAVSVARATNWLNDTVMKQAALDHMRTIEDQYSEILLLTSNEMLSSSGSQIKNTPAFSSSDESTSFFDTAFVESEYHKPIVKAEPVVAVLSDIISKNAGNGEMDSVNNRFKVNMTTQTEDKSYGTVQVKVDSIAGSIPLGQRFMFVNQLFSRNSEHFEKAIYELDNAKSYEEAEDMIWHRYASKYAWDINGEAVKELLVIVKRKFQ
jgi:hypothetical protein